MSTGHGCDFHRLVFAGFQQGGRAGVGRRNLQVSVAAHQSDQFCSAPAGFVPLVFVIKGAAKSTDAPALDADLDYLG